MNYERLQNSFIEMIKLPSESRNEKEFAMYLKSKLESLGFETKIDNSDIETGSNVGNLLARLKGNKNVQPVLFATHMDTVTPGIGINPVIEDGYIKTDGKTILGSDDKAGIAAFIEAVTSLIENNEEFGDIEALFSTCEEVGLLGAKNTEISFFNSKIAYALDASGAPGTLITQAPSHDILNVKVFGKAVHAGLEPEKGISAIIVLSDAISNMNLLRIDSETTANVGTINGGSANNIVAESCEATFEARSLNETKLDSQIKHMLSCLRNSCDKFNTDFTYELYREYPTLVISDDSPVVQIFKNACDNLNISFVEKSTGGGSDANILSGKGFSIAVPAIGMENPHSVNEMISIENLNNMARLTKEIILLMK